MEYKIPEWEAYIFKTPHGKGHFIKNFLGINISALLSVTWSSTELVVSYVPLGGEPTTDRFTIGTWLDYYADISAT